MYPDLTDEQEQLRATVGKIADERYAPLALTWDEERVTLPLEDRTRLAELGLLGIALPVEYGGAGAPLLDALIALEELAKRSPAPAFAVFEANTGPARVIEILGTDEQKKRILPAVASGEVTVALAISEPDAGSAATDLRTTARREGDSLVIDGMKRWSSGAGEAEMYLVYCRMEDTPGSKGVGAVIVEADTPGLTFGQRERLMGFRSVPSCDMFFDGVRVPIENVVVGPGGFRDLFTVFSIERLGNATMSLALGQAALDKAAAYVQEREQFGAPIVDFQAVQMAIAEMIVEVEAARMLLWRAAVSAGVGTPDPLQASLAKYASNAMAKRVTATGIELLGGYGYSVEYEMERLHRDAHGWAIAGGTPAMQRVRIAASFLGRRFEQRRS